MAGTQFIYPNLVSYNPPPPEPSPILDGLQVWWDANNASSYPGSGTTFTDLSGNGNDGTINGSPTYVSSGPNWFLFDNTSGKNIYLSHTMTTNMSVEIWLYTGVGPSGFPRYFSYAPSDNAELSIETDGDWFGYPNNGNNWYHLGGYTQPLSDYTQLVYTKTSGGTGTVYVNGSQQGSTFTSNWGTSGTGMYVGQRHSSYTEGFVGGISIVRVYDTALSSDDVLNNYDYDKATFGLS